MRRHLTFANVVSCIALFVALGGSAVAAKSMIDGSQVRKGSLPADRLKKASITAAEVKTDGLTGAQIQEGTLATVPSAAHAATADSAKSADSAGSAHHSDESAQADEAAHAADSSHAADADALGGLGPGAFASASEFRTGAADPKAVPAATILDLPEIEARIETDGNADFDKSFFVHNAGTTNLGLISPSGEGNLPAGATNEINAGNNGWTSENYEAMILLQRLNGPSAMVHCYFPGAGLGRVLTFCEASGFAAP